MLKKKINNVFQPFLNYVISLRTINNVGIFATSLSNVNVRLILWQELQYWYNSAVPSGTVLPISEAVYGEQHAFL